MLEFQRKKKKHVSLVKKVYRQRPHSYVYNTDYKALNSKLGSDTLKFMITG